MTSDFTQRFILLSYMFGDPAFVFCVFEVLIFTCQ